MKYKVGDKVRIKSPDWYYENRDKIDQIDCGNVCFVRNMETLCGKIVTISSILPTLEAYRIEEDDGEFNWADEMIERLVERDGKTYPYKIGDRVVLKGRNRCATITDLKYDSFGNLSYYINIDNDKDNSIVYPTDLLLPYDKLVEEEDKETNWKPSKEEMDVLYGLAYITNKYDEHKEEVIARLYQDLKREFFNGSSYENMFPNTENDVRRRSTIQVLEYARSLDNYNQYGKVDIDKNIAWLEKQGEIQNNMNENIDLTKILDGCPSGTEFYSTIFGKVSLMRVYNNTDLPIVIVTDRDLIGLTSDGRYFSQYDGECTLFPSKDQRDWFKFVRFWDKPKAKKFDMNTLQPFDKVLVRTELKGVWNIDLFGYKKDPFAVCLDTAINDCIPYNEETKHLLGTNDDCPDYYKWWEE